MLTPSFFPTQGAFDIYNDKIYAVYSNKGNHQIGTYTPYSNGLSLLVVRFGVEHLTYPIKQASALTNYTFRYFPNGGIDWAYYSQYYPPTDTFFIAGGGSSSPMNIGSYSWSFSGSHMAWIIALNGTSMGVKKMATLGYSNFNNWRSGIMIGERIHLLGVFSTNQSTMGNDSWTNTNSTTAVTDITLARYNVDLQPVWGEPPVVTLPSKNLTCVA